MTKHIRIAIAAAVLGAATASLAGPPDAVYSISPTVPARTTTSPRTDLPVPPYSLTGQPAPKNEPTEWRWVLQNYGGKVIQVIPVR